MSTEHDTHQSPHDSNDNVPSVTKPSLSDSSLTDRTPRPYFRDGGNVRQDATQVASANGTNIVSGAAHREWQHGDGSESGTEADDERPQFVKQLPPATLRPRKGLKTGESNADILLTPSQLDPDGRSMREDYWGMPMSGVRRERSSRKDNAEEREKLRRRRIGEFARRSSEVALVGVMATLVFCGRGVAATAKPFVWALLCYVLTIVGLVLAYPVKLSLLDARTAHTRFWQRFRVPASFDPATVLYPPLLPLLVALAVSPLAPQVISPNVVLGLCCLPQRLFPRSSRLAGINSVHWLISTLPLYAYEFGVGYMTPSSTITGVSIETLVSLYPLHHALMVPLFYVTQTSLLLSELHLLSAALINLLLLSQSPQAVILKACLWIGGVPLFALCALPLSWNITLTRVPTWKFRRQSHGAKPGFSLLDAVTTIIFTRSVRLASKRNDTSDSDGDDLDQDVSSLTRKSLYDDSLAVPSFESISHLPRRWTSGRRMQEMTSSETARPRRNTLPSEPLPTSSKPLPRRSHESNSKPSVHWCLRLTVKQAQLRKWIYSGTFYLTTICLILGPIQYYVYKYALAHQNPILWAIGYMAGQLPFVAPTLHLLKLVPHTHLPAPTLRNWGDLRFDRWSSWPLQVDDLRSLLGAANCRLLLVAYWAAVLLLGLLTVFNLTAYVEVDTRRKVFHGVMVAMFLPSIFIDPCCCALALALVLAVFLLLEVVRAGQVLPLGNRIGHFIAPYVDGRDLRGPVVVSHIFLLIGCAVPLWFSLAAIPRTDTDNAWSGWELLERQREVAMVAGVICVGMGDAAASLIGRRYGRHKWPWVGGKSLEGSGAFALAVTIGLLAAKLWLVYGGWADTHEADSALSALSWMYTTLKAILCACGASFMEAVLTGANDNVVVPIALWLLVKGCRL